MKITLTNRSLEITKSEGTIEEGTELHYYHTSGSDSYHTGTVGKDDEGLYIEWDIDGIITRLDGSDHASDVLRKCGWG